MLPLATPRRLLPSLAQHAGFVSALCLAIAILLTVMDGGRGFGPKLVYSTCIGVSCWLLVDGLRNLVAWWQHRRRPAADGAGTEWANRWLVLAPVMLLASTLGPVLGIALGDRLTGGVSAPMWPPSSRAAQLTLTLAVLGTLAATFAGITVERLRSARAEAQAARTLATETRLRLLQSQLEPHMLFNTLANLRVLIGLDPPRAQQMLDRLIAFLRTTLAASQAPTHALEREFQWLDDYLALMRVRMGERLAVRLELPPALAAQPVPPLLLQPLVENAVRHGVEPQVGASRIEVSAARDGHTLLLRVRDTGVGLERATPVPGGGFGLRQVRERLHALYGTRGSLTLEEAADADGGTLATLRLPLAGGESTAIAP
jgi:sensor histidine kinase YesM